jgi:hypothetical protein
MYSRKKIFLHFFQRWICFFLLLFSFSSFSQTKKFSSLPDNNKSLYFLAGLPNLEWENPMAEAAKNFGFSYYRVAGCVMPEDFRKHIDKHNKKLEKKLEIKYTGWQQKFHAECDRLHILFRLADTILMKSQDFWDNYPVIATGKIPFHYFKQTEGDSVIILEIADVDEWINNNKLLSYKRFLVDIKSKEVKVLANSQDDL